MAHLICPGWCGWSVGDTDEAHIRPRLEEHMLHCAKAHATLEHMRLFALHLIEELGIDIEQLDDEFIGDYEYGGWPLVARSLVSHYKTASR